MRLSGRCFIDGTVLYRRDGALTRNYRRDGGIIDGPVLDGRIIDGTVLDGGIIDGTVLLLITDGCSRRTALLEQEPVLRPPRAGYVGGSALRVRR